MNKILIRCGKVSWWIMGYGLCIVIVVGEGGWLSLLLGYVLGLICIIFIVLKLLNDEFDICF